MRWNGSRRNRLGLGVVALAGAGLGGLGSVTGCAVNEATGERQFLIMDRQTAIATGSEASPQLTAEYGGAVSDRVATGYVTEVGERLAAVTEGDNPGLPWEFTLLDSEVINAFALPGGKVFISKGLAARMRNEAQLAGVLGHEIGHVTAKHVNDRIVQNAGAQLGVQLVTSWLGGGEPGLTAQIVQTMVPVAGQGIVLRYGREQELQADSLGMRYMARVGYDPAGQLQVMRILQEAAGGAGGIELLSTHPFPETRIEHIEELLAGEYAGMAGEYYPERFEQRMLSRIGRVEVNADGPGEGGLGDPVHWCGVCASDAGVDQASLRARAQLP